MQFAQSCPNKLFRYLYCFHFLGYHNFITWQISTSVRRVFQDAVSYATIQWEGTFVLAWQGIHFWRVAGIVLVSMHIFPINICLTHGVNGEALQLHAVYKKAFLLQVT